MIREMQEALSRLVSVFRRKSLDQDFEDEFTTHIDLLTQKNESRGLPHDEARRQAILQIGGLNATKDLHREARGSRVLVATCGMPFALWRRLVPSPSCAWRRWVSAWGPSSGF